MTKASDFNNGDIVLATKGSNILQGEVTVNSYGDRSLSLTGQWLSSLVNDGYTLEVVSRAVVEELSPNAKVLTPLKDGSLIKQSGSVYLKRDGKFSRVSASGVDSHKYSVEDFGKGDWDNKPSVTVIFEAK